MTTLTIELSAVRDVAALLGDERFMDVDRGGIFTDEQVGKIIENYLASGQDPDEYLDTDFSKDI